MNQSSPLHHNSSLARSWVLFLGGFGFLLQSCRVPESRGPAPLHCDARGTVEPRWESPPPIPSSPYSLSLEVTATAAWVKGQIAPRVPTLLAQGERDVGAPGRVTYRVQRGGFELGLNGERLVVTTPISADVSVCKPLGPFCPVYGRCHPQLVSRATVPLLLGPQYQIGESTVAASVVQGCSIVGFDVTNELASQANDEAANVKRQIDAQRPELMPGLEQAFELLSQPIAVDARSCLRVTVAQVGQRRPQFVNGTLSTGLTAQGTLSWERPCLSAKEATIKVSPPLLHEEVPGIEDSHLGLPIRVAWSEVGPELAQALSQEQGAPKIPQITVVGALLDGTPRAVVQIRAEGACSDLRLVTEPWYSASDNAVHFRPLRAVDGAASGLSEGQIAAISKRLEDQGRWVLPVHPEHAKQMALAMFSQLGQSQLPGLNLDVGLVPMPGRVFLDGTGLVALVGLEGRVAARFQ